MSASEAPLYDEVDLVLCRIGVLVADALTGRSDRDEAMDAVAALADAALSALTSGEAA